MRSPVTMRRSVIASATLLLALVAPSLAGAQSAPSAAPTPIPVPTLPPQTHPDPWVQMGVDVLRNVYQHNVEQRANSASGTVSYFRRFDMQVQTGQGAYRTVHLHQGTVINPRGATPNAGTRVRVTGRAQADGSIEADQIDLQ